MIGNLKPYPKYKGSGQPWIGDVPAEWDMRRGKWLFQNQKELNTNRENKNVLSLTLRGVVNNDPDDPEGLVPKDYATYQLFKKGDLVFKLIDLENLRTSRVGLVHEDGIMSSAYVRLISRNGGNIRFFFHQYFDLYSRGVYNQIGAGVRSTLGAPDLLDVGIIVPPRDEQDAIVRFLDHANGRIERAIRTKKKLVALLHEQKQAIIHRAVTRGLDLSVPLKPSGIPWLGDIPKHWEARKLRHLTRQIIDGTHFTPAYRDSGVAFMRVTDIHENEINESKLRRITKQEHLQLNKRCNPEKGDLLLSKNGTIGVTKVVDWDFPFSIFVSLCLIKPIKAIVNPHFISFAFAGGLLERQLSEITKTTSVTNLHLDKIRTLVIPLPPLNEQANILRRIEEELVPIVSAIDRTQREIALLGEYHTRLVADVVTGKLDVRAAAHDLPAHGDEPTMSVSDESEELIEEEHLA